MVCVPVFHSRDHASCGSDMLWCVGGPALCVACFSVTILSVKTGAGVLYWQGIVSDQCIPLLQVMTSQRWQYRLIGTVCTQFFV